MDTVTGENVELRSNVVDHAVVNDTLEQKAAPGISMHSRADMPVVSDTSALASFLQREISIGTATWNLGSPIFFRIDPWTSFLQSASVKDKIRYYSRFKADLKIRLNISGTPFHYGKAMLTYRPHPGLSMTGDPVYNLGVAMQSTASAVNLKIIESQLAGIKFHPGYDTSIEMTVPYVHYRPGIEVSLGSYWDIGTLSIIELIPLQHANGGTGGVSIDVLASMVNVEMDVPTALPLGFSIDDALKKVAKLLPAFMKATELAMEYGPMIQDAAQRYGPMMQETANGFSNIAFSRPATREATIPIKIVPFQLANYDMPDTVERLAISAGSEADISGQSVGATEYDELCVNHIASRPSFLISASWTTANPRGTFLLGSFVTPVQSSVSTYTKAPTVAPLPAKTFANVDHVCQTPVSFVASLFTHARFDMVFRYTVVCSPYHKGRLRVWYDPHPRAFVSPSLNLANSVVIDLAEEASAEIVVPWQNVRDACRLDSPFILNSFNSVAPFNIRSTATSTDFCNGMIVCEVLNPLSAPIDGSNVYVYLEVYAKAFAGYGPMLPQNINGAATATDMDAVPYTPLGFDISCGEAVATLRQLMKRYTQAYVDVNYSTASTGAMREITSYLPIQLPPPGYSVFGTAQLDFSPAALSINYTSWTFRSYIAQAYALCRGSVRWKGSIQRRNNSATGQTVAHISRDWARRTTRRISTAVLPSSVATNPDKSFGARTYRDLSVGDQGTQIISTENGETFYDVEFPYVSTYRARNARAGLMAVVSDQSDFMNARFVSTISPSTDANNYVMNRIFEAVGEDYNLFYFVHAPALLSAIPTEN
jgi:hypothetical protein